MKRILQSFLLLSVALPLTGCSGMKSFDDHERCLRNKCLAQCAWHEWSWCYDDLEHSQHFAGGFKTGYKDILDGGKGCQPTLPPERYWKCSYESHDGRRRINAWFDGFSHGALAALQDGYGKLSGIPLSPTARLNHELASSHPQPLDSYGHGGAPPPVIEVEDLNVPEPLLPAETPDDVEGPENGSAEPLRPYEDE